MIPAPIMPIMAGRVTAGTMAVLRTAWRRVAEAPVLIGPEVLSGSHNPFGRAALLVDSWTLLEVCQSADILDVVEGAIGPDIILWESELIVEASGSRGAAAAHRDPGLWPIDPPSGVSVRIPISDGGACDFTLDDGLVGRAGAAYVIRYMPATALYNRDPTFPSNRRAAELAPLINFARRPIWLVRGIDRADNDFVTGFSSTVGQWSQAPW